MAQFINGVNQVSDNSQDLPKDTQKKFEEVLCTFSEYRTVSSTFNKKFDILIYYIYTKTFLTSYFLGRPTLNRLLS